MTHCPFSNGSVYPPPNIIIHFTLFKGQVRGGTGKFFQRPPGHGQAKSASDRYIPFYALWIQTIICLLPQLLQLCLKFNVRPML